MMLFSISLPCGTAIVLNAFIILAHGEIQSHSLTIPQPPPHFQQCPNSLSIFSNATCPIPTLSASQQITTKSKHHPWDSEPACTRIINFTGEHNFCIHTCSTFSNGRGISILTTPEIATTIANSPAFQPSSNLLDEPPQQAISPPFESSLPPPFPPPYEIKDIPGRGKGLVANRTIQFGEMISFNTPLVIIQKEIFDANVGLLPEQRLALLRETVAALPSSSQDLFYEQCTRESGVDLLSTRTHPEAEIEDILKTNSYTGWFTPSSASSESEVIHQKGTEQPTTLPHGLNIPESSRLNHACRPNTDFVFDVPTLTHKIHAVTTITPGQEITTSYISLLDPFETRQSQLLHHWGFHCTCTHCHAPSTAHRQSNARLSLINQYRKYLMDWSPESIGTPSLSEKYIELLKKEQLWSMLGEAYTIAALRFSAWEREEEAVMYARLAGENGLWWNGEERSDLVAVGGLVMERRGHWSWGLGRKLRVGRDGEEPVGDYMEKKEREKLAFAQMNFVKQHVIKPIKPAFGS